MKMKKQWTIFQLEQALQNDYTSCTSEFERINCKAFAGMEIRERAKSIRQTRALTSNELEIAEKYGYRET
jgi:hypothetical protein